MSNECFIRQIKQKKVDICVNQNGEGGAKLAVVGVKFECPQCRSRFTTLQQATIGQVMLIRKESDNLESCPERWTNQFEATVSQSAASDANYPHDRFGFYRKIFRGRGAGN